MISRARTKAIQGLIAGTLALSSHFPDADAASASSDDPFVDALVAEVEQGGLDVPDRVSVLRRLALSPSGAVRARVAESAGALSDEAPAALSLLRQLSHDAAGVVRSAAARGLAHFIEHASDPVRAAVESAWATAPTSDERVALARALGLATPDWLTDLALQELAADPSPPVRHAALDAAHAQLARNPAPYLELAAAHSADPDRRVRKSARHLLRKAEATGSPTLAMRPTASELRASRHRLRRALHDSRHSTALS
ncbi:MAG TPA: HEAT repeat domain-containing protein [Polyangiaceae bacterium]|nr:HEAT repeat domain-containing protein [Polyangiaceae bacterium]